MCPSSAVGGHLSVVNASDSCVEMLRHSQISMTLDTYAHVASKTQRDAAASLEAALVEFATPATERTLPPENASGTIKMTPELLNRYGMDMLPGPDPLRPEAAGPAA